eukprot:gene13784-15855_t
MVGFDKSVFRNCRASLAQYGSQADSQQAADQLHALIDHSFAALTAFVEECVFEDPELTYDVCTLLNALFTVWYESGSLNETTLKTWRLFPRILERHGRELDLGNAHDFCKLLMSYCSEGLESFHINHVTLSEGVDSYLEQHNSTIKLIGFFTLRLLELLRFGGDQLRNQMPAALSLVFRYISVLHLIGQYLNSVSSQVTKTYLYLRQALQFKDARKTAAATLLHVIKADTSSPEVVYQTHMGALCCAIDHVEQYSLQIAQFSENIMVDDDVVINIADVANWIGVFILAMQSMCIESTGQMDDAVLLGLLQRMVQALATVVSLVTSETDLQLLVHACIGTAPSRSSATSGVCSESAKCNISRMLMSGVLTSFHEDAQLPLVQTVWHVCRTALLHCGCGAEVESIALHLRTVLLVVGKTPRYELLCAILRFSDVTVLEAGNSSSAHGSSQVPQAVQERLLAVLPVTHLLSQEEEDPGQMLLSKLVAQSVASIENYAGAPGSGSRAENGFIEIGRALSILRASSGHMEASGVVSKAGQCNGYRQAREPIVRNISLGTAILRWISSLSQHIKILLPSPADTTSSSTELNIHRLNRVERLVDTLTALVQCLWSHAVPRAVQDILARAAKCCAETAVSVLSHDVRAKTDAELVVNVADKLLRCVATTLTVIANPSFSEKSVDAVKAVYAEWYRANNLCTHYSHPDICSYGWQELVRMLASLQRFANSLPGPLKPRARELVDPALVSVIQARALGRTFSLTLRRDISDEVVTDRSLAQALCIGLHDVTVSRLLEDSATQSPRQDDREHPRSKEHRDGPTTEIGPQETNDTLGCYDSSDENKGSEGGRADYGDVGGYEEIYATAGTEADEEKEEHEEGRDEERDFNEDGNSLQPTKRQRSGTQGSNDDEVDESFVDEFIY